MKRSIAVLLVLLLMTLPLPGFAEEQAEAREAILNDYASDLDKTNRSFTIPINVAVIHAVVLYKDHVGIVFTPIQSNGVALGLESLSFLMDLRQINFDLTDGSQVSIPAVLQIMHVDGIGAYVCLNLSLEAFQSVSALVSSGSTIVELTFMQNSGASYSMTVEELEQSLRDAFGGSVDFVNDITQATSLFWNNLSHAIGAFASDAYSSIEAALLEAGEAIEGLTNSAKQAVSDAVNAAGEVFSSASDEANQFLEDAAESVSGFFSVLWDQ